MFSTNFNDYCYFRNAKIFFNNGISFYYWSSQLRIWILKFEDQNSISQGPSEPFSENKNACKKSQVQQLLMKLKSHSYFMRILRKHVFVYLFEIAWSLFFCCVFVEEYLRWPGIKQAGQAAAFTVRPTVHIGAFW